MYYRWHRSTYRPTIDRYIGRLSVGNCKIFVDHITCRKNFKPYFSGVLCICLEILEITVVLRFLYIVSILREENFWLRTSSVDWIKLICFASQIKTENILNLINQGLYQHVKCSQVIGEFCHEWFREHADDFQFFSQKQNLVYRHYQ